jgi:phosphoribosylglycinamide formyltransferase-1
MKSNSSSDLSLEMPVRICGFISGSGTNLVHIIEHQHELQKRVGKPVYEVVLIFTDNKDGRAEEISSEHEIPYICRDINDFYQGRGHENKRDLSLRPEFDLKTVDAIREYRVDVIALAGYMSIVTEPLLNAYPGRIFNVHPADLSIKTAEGRRRFTGLHAVKDAILAGEKELRASTHVVRAEVDYGEIILISRPIPVEVPSGFTLEELGRPGNAQRLLQLVSEHQDRLKAAGDWVIYPKTLELFSTGKIRFDKEGGVYLDNRNFENGIMWEVLEKGSIV